MPDDEKLILLEPSNMGTPSSRQPSPSSQLQQHQSLPFAETSATTPLRKKLFPKATPTGYRPHPGYMFDSIIEGWPSPEDILDQLSHHH